MATAKQRAAARRNVKKARAAWKRMSHRARARAMPGTTTRYARAITSKIKHPGAYRASVRKRFGARGFNKNGTIKASIINRDAHRSPPDHIAHMAQLAKGLRTMGREKRRKR